MNKLSALDFYSPNNFEYLDDKVFRNFVSWLENQKIRLYKIEDRYELDNVESDDWPKAFEKYLNETQLEGLTLQTEREIQIEKLLSLALRYDYADNLEKYSTPDEMNIEPAINAETNPLENLNYQSEEFKQGLYNVMRILNVPAKLDDNTSNLQAVSKLISEKLNPSTIAALQNSNNLDNPNKIQLQLETINLGFDSQDKVLNNAAKILRLLHIKELRDLQTKINETIVSIQNVTANPKTDSSLGRVGR